MRLYSIVFHEDKNPLSALWAQKSCSKLMESRAENPRPYGYIAQMYPEWLSLTLRVGELAVYVQKASL